MLPKIGFIGQGFVGKNMADDFEDRGFMTTRYSLEQEYIGNKDKIRECDIVFIAVPTPTKPSGFDDSILRDQIKLIGKGKTAVIKSTVLPGTTESLQKENPDIFVLHSPEFLIASTAKENTKNPDRNIIGIPVDNNEYRQKAELVLSLLPKAPYSSILLSKESELVKYIGNNFLYTKVIFMNLMYDLALKIGADWSKISEAVGNDPRIGKSHMNPVHASICGVTKVGRGAGGPCFIKDFEALRQFYLNKTGDKLGELVLSSLANKNIELLSSTSKDMDILKGVYGESITISDKE